MKVTQSGQTSVEAVNLSRKQKQQLKQKLEDLKESILENIALKTRMAVDRSNECESLIKGDDAEVAEKQRTSNAILQEIDMMKSRLGLVERALFKMKTGRYGFCEDTEEHIGFERLWAVPWARYSVSVQEKRERQMREFRGSRRLHA